MADQSDSLEALQVRHAIRMGKQYLKFSRNHFGNGLRYTMPEYLRMQGVRPDLIERATLAATKALEKYLNEDRRDTATSAV